jgi:Tfp pilus assembly protein PilF
VVTLLDPLYRWLEALANSESLALAAKVMAVLGWALAMVALALWGLHRLAVRRRQAQSVPPAPSPAATAPVPPAPPGEAALTLEQFTTFLKARDRELQKEMAELREKEVEVRAILAKEREAIQEKFADLPGSFKQWQDQLAEVGRALGDFRREFSPDLLERAREALARGDTGLAESLLRQALGRDTKLEAAASFQLGVLAESQMNYFLAAQYYCYAAQLQPKNLAHLSAAGEFAYYLRHYKEAERLLKGAFEIQEKLLGSEHPEVAQRLNNLGALYHAIGGYEKAEALYQWALEIDEASLGPHHPNVATYLENYAGLLRDTGRDAEAAIMEARVKAIRDHQTRVPAV